MPLPIALRLTYEDYRELPDDGRRYEIVEGDLYVTPAPSSMHQIVVVNLLAILYAWVRSHALGRVLVSPIDVILADDTIVQPDIVFVSASRSSIIAPRGIEGAPDLVVEVLSPGTRARDLGLKRRLYGRFAVGEYWTVDIGSRTLTIHALHGRTYRVAGTASANVDATSRALGGLRLTAADIFEGV